MFEKISEAYDYSWIKEISAIWSEWKDAVERTDIRLQLAGLFLIFTFYFWFIPGFFHYIQHRHGMVLSDPILNHLPVMNLSSYCLAILYISVIATILYLLTKPDYMIVGLVGYAVLLGLRLLMIYLVPLDPPSKIIPLKDPFIDSLFYANTHITKDLFFSGHVSTMFILYLGVDKPGLRKFLLVGCVFIAAILLIQHVHYTLDIIAAPFFAWLAYHSAEQLHRKLSNTFGRKTDVQSDHYGFNG